MEAVAVQNKVKQVVSNIRNLPTPPIVFNQIQNALSQPNVSAGQVAAILSEDPAMSAQTRHNRFNRAKLQEFVVTLGFAQPKVVLEIDDDELLVFERELLL